MKCDNGGLVVGVIFILVGVGLLLGNFFDFNLWDLISTYWPVIFIIIGASILIKHWK